MLFKSLVVLAAGLQIATAASDCSSENTGSDTSAVTSIYQTTGLCQQTCNDYTYAVVQYQSCWCSNSAPSSTVDSSKCDTRCPGYPDQICGSQSASLFSYVEVGTVPAPYNYTGAASVSSAASASTSAVSATSATSTPSSVAGYQNSTVATNGTATGGSSSKSNGTTVSNSSAPISKSDTGAASAGATFSMAATGLVLVLMVALTL